MTTPCDDLVRFADGELDDEPERAEAFRAHLRTCAACRDGLVEAMQLGVRLSGLLSTSEHANPAPAPTESPKLSVDVSPSKPRDSRSKRTRRLAAWISPVVAAAAVVGLLMYWPRQHQTHDATDAFAALKTRPYEIRLAYPGAAAHKPVREEMLGTEGPSGEHIPHATLGALENRGNKYALAIAEAVNGAKLTEVAAQLQGLKATPEVRSDRAAIEILLKGKDLASSNDNVETILAELEALRRGSDTAARAARWNYAIMLERLDLPLSAAKEFQAIADEHETGWSDEALRRAERARQQKVDKRWDDARAAGEALIHEATPVPLEVVRRFPGLMRGYLYNAMCTAPTRGRVLALAPMAAELDRLNGQVILREHVRRVAKLDFRRRAPLAAGYARVLGGKPATAEIQAELANPDPLSADVIDIVMWGLPEFEATIDHRDAFRRMVKQAGDPWLEIILGQADAWADLRKHDWLGAEARLRKAQSLCNRGVEYRCLSVARALSQLYQELFRVPEAVAVAQDSLRMARSLGEWGFMRNFLLRLGDVERFNSSIATARAYTNEALLMSVESDEYYRAAQMRLVGIAIRELDGRAARRALHLALGDGKPTISAANSLADIGRLDPQPGDLAQLRSWLAALRASRTLTDGQQVLADEIEGRLVIESDRAAGAALLERAIAMAPTMPQDVIAEQARTGAYSVLMFDAARSGDYARVMTLIASQRGLSPPDACTVGTAAEDERAVMVVRGNDGKDAGIYQNARRASDDVPSVSRVLARGLEHCSHVLVMANPMLQGQPRALPASVPWSYVTGTHGRSSSRDDAATPPQALIVANVTPPDYLHLPPLSPQITNSKLRTIMLSGPTATPAAVLAEMTTATEIQFHTHALVSADVSDASHLVLSQGSEGGYALTTEAIRGTQLRGHPIVVLAACHSAQGARYQHTSWSLPDAFLAVGARAVFAAAASIPDQEAAVFFARVLERTRMGTDPAIALRDERLAALAANPSSWVADVILFE